MLQVAALFENKITVFISNIYDKPKFIVRNWQNIREIKEVRSNERRATACDPTAQIFCHFAIVCTFTVCFPSSFSKKLSHFVRIRIVILAPVPAYIGSLLLLKVKVFFPFF